MGESDKNIPLNEWSSSDLVDQTDTLTPEALQDPISRMQQHKEAITQASLYNPFKDITGEMVGLPLKMSRSKTIINEAQEHLESVLDKMRQEAIDSMIKKQEDLIKDAINYALGRSDWTMDEIKSSFTWVMDSSSRTRTLTYKNKALIIFWEHIRTKEVDGRLSLIQDYKELYKENTDVKKEI